MFAEILLPNPEQLRLEEISLEAETVVLNVIATQRSHCCPICQASSSKVHSYYQRKLADLPCGGLSIRLIWTVRRFFCENRLCKRATFVEQISTVADRYARRTRRLSQQQTWIAFLVGGEPGARLTRQLEMPTSPDTLLRMIRKAPEEEITTPRVLGVDDWAIRKGCTYGTILVDLETHQTIDLLTERSADVLAKWLQAHPGVEIISRDRSNEYAKGAMVGAPNAQQVADRWHLIKNLREALELFLEQNRHCLRAAGEAEVQPEGREPGLDPAPEGNQTIEKTGSVSLLHNRSKLTKPKAKRQIIRNKRLERYNKVVELHNQGNAIREIARQLGLHRTTVRKYIYAGEFPEIAQRRKMPTKLDPYLAYLEERWQSGCRNRLQLWREICEQGFDGTHQLVYIWTQKKGFVKKGSAKTQKEQPLIHKVATPKARPWSASRASWLLFIGENDLKSEEKSALKRMIDAEPAVETVMTLAHEFRSILIDRQAELLPAWLNRARGSGISTLRSFVNGLENDLSAVTAAFTLGWSNGPTEGNVNRLKLIKRQMYGRANFDLLRRRVLGMPSAP